MCTYYIYICKSFIFKIYCFVIIVTSCKWMNKNNMYLRKQNLMIEVFETSWILIPANMKYPARNPSGMHGRVFHVGGTWFAQGD